MSIKPFSQIVDEEKVEQEELKPFMDEAKGGIKIDEDILHAKEIAMAKEGFVKRTINFLGSFWGIVSASVIFTFVVVMIDTLKTLEDVFSSNSPLDALYFSALLFLAFTLLTATLRYYKQIKVLKSVHKTQKFFAEQKVNPNKKIVGATLKLLDRYMQDADEKVQLKAKLLRSSINSSQDYTQIYKDLDFQVLGAIDKKVQERIKTASTQAAISTAISPLALLDSAIVVWRAFLLTREIAFLYGYKPGFISTVSLLKQGAFNIFFAGVAELSSEYISSATETTFLSKLSFMAGQGITNGILLARLGYGVMAACRPLPTDAKRESFLKGIYSSIKKLVV